MYYAEKDISMRRIFHLAVLFLFLTVSVQAEVAFSGLNLNENDRLLFRVQADSPEMGRFDSLFSADLPSDEIGQLTFFPEHVMYLQQLKSIQIQNRFGVYRIGSDLSHPQAIPQFPSFNTGEEIGSGKLQRVSSSPDGRYLLYLEPVSAAYADLILLNVSSGEKHSLADELTLSYDRPNASWSEDSNFFVYEKDNKIYYFSMDQFRRNEVIAENLRLLGPGSLSNIRWGEQNQLYYLKGSVLYKIRSAEFFTRSFYSDLLDAGQVVGKIPFKFNSNFDSFYISPDGEKMLFNKSGRNLLLYFLKGDDYLSTGSSASLPYLYLPRNSRVKRVLWSNDDMITVMTGSVESGEQRGRLFRLQVKGKEGENGSLEPLIFENLSEAGIRNILLSPDKNLAALLFEDRVVIRRYSDWELQRRIEHPEPLHLVWTAGDELVVAGSKIIERYDLGEGGSELITLSQAGEYGYDDEGTLFTEIEGRYYSYEENRGWSKSSRTDVELQPPSVVSENYRAYLSPRAGDGNYRNVVMIRHIKEYKTTMLGKNSGHSYEPFPEKSEPVDFSNFRHGSRLRRREIALVFNAIDSVEGLTEVLTDLEEYGLTCTFFVNGEFMRRNPEAVQELAESGHEIASLFYTYFNMTDARYRISTDFIKKGLARNEDEFFNITSDEQGQGSELALMWHAPYYFVNSAIISASKEMNYTYIGYDVDPLDWVPKTEQRDGMYRSAPELVERLMDLKQPGSIIPIRIGMGEEERDDYLFQHLDLLINGLIEKGYRIVPVSTLMEHAK